jgi:hypothetical protein
MKKYRYLRGTLFDIERELKTRNSGADKAISEAFASQDERENTINEPTESTASQPAATPAAATPAAATPAAVEANPRDFSQLIQNYNQSEDQNQFKEFLYKLCASSYRNTLFENTEQDYLKVIQTVAEANNLSKLYSEVLNEKQGNFIKQRADFMQLLRLINLASNNVINVFGSPDHTEVTTFREIVDEFLKAHKEHIAKIETPRIHKTLMKEGGIAFLTPSIMALICRNKSWGRNNDFNFIGSFRQGQNTLKMMRMLSTDINIQSMYGDQETFESLYIQSIQDPDTRQRVQALKTPEKLGDFVLPLSILEYRLGASGVWLGGRESTEFEPELGFINEDRKAINFFALKINLTVNKEDGTITLPPAYAAGAWAEKWMPGGFTIGGTAEMAMPSLQFPKLRQAMKEKHITLQRYRLTKEKQHNTFIVSEQDISQIFIPDDPRDQEIPALWGDRSFWQTYGD